MTSSDIYGTDGGIPIRNDDEYLFWLKELKTILNSINDIPQINYEGNENDKAVQEFQTVIKYGLQIYNKRFYNIESGMLEYTKKKENDNTSEGIKTNGNS